MMRYLLLLSLLVIVIFLGGWSTLAECPHGCPECFTDIPYIKTDPDLGIVTKECVSAHCDMMPWCFEVKVYKETPRSLLIPWEYRGKLIMDESFKVTEPNMSFTRAPGVTKSVRNGEATVCISKNFELPIPLGDLSGNAGVIGLRLGHVEPKACLDSCPCSGGSPPSVSVETPKVRKHHILDIPIFAFDTDGDLCDVEYRGQFSHGKIVESEVQEIIPLQLVSSCEEHIFINQNPVGLVRT